MKNRRFAEVRVDPWVVLAAIVILLLAGKAWPGSSPSAAPLIHEDHKITASNETQEIEMVMGEFFFQVRGQEPGAPLVLKAGDHVEMMIKNAGKTEHEAMFGETLNADGHGYRDNFLMTLESLWLKPGNSVKISLKIPVDYKGKAFEIGCFIPGHYKAGMKVPIIVE